MTTGSAQGAGLGVDVTSRLGYGKWQRVRKKRRKFQPQLLQRECGRIPASSSPSEHGPPVADVHVARVEVTVRRQKLVRTGGADMSNREDEYDYLFKGK